MHMASRSDEPSIIEIAMSVPDRSTLTESRTLHGSTPLHQLTFTRTCRPSTDAWSVVGATAWGFFWPGFGITIVGAPAAGSTGVGSTIAPPPTPLPGLSPTVPPPAPGSPEGTPVGGAPALGGCDAAGDA